MGKRNRCQKVGEEYSKRGGRATHGDITAEHALNHLKYDGGHDKRKRKVIFKVQVEEGMRGSGGE